MNRAQKIILSFAIVCLVASIALPVSAGLLDLPQFEDPCDVCEFARLASVIKNLALEIAMPLGAVFIIIGGVILSASAGIQPQIERAKQIIRSAIVGMVIFLCAWLIVSAIMAATLGRDIGSSWWTITCPDDTQCKYQQGSRTPTTPGPTTPGEYGCTGTPCGGKDANVNICGPVDPGTNCDAASINGSYDSAMRAGAGGIEICSGIDTIAMLKAIMSNESHGSMNAQSSKGAYGPYQMKPDTANQYAAQCGVNEPITGDWLKSGHMEEQSCMAALFLKSLVGACGCDARQLAAGYNGGGAGTGACNTSTNCGPAAAGEGGECQACSGQSGSTRRWECLWDDNAHTQCNNQRPGGSFEETRQYAPFVEHCYQQFGT